jgi:uncharacterized protein (TIGR02145 family)
MADNLRVSRFRNGSEIPTNLNNSEWGNANYGAYAIYSHSSVDGIDTDEEMVAAYGMLYNWYAVDDSRGLCPEGWHVPGDAEWKQLEIHLGMTQEEADSIDWRGTREGGKMKTARTEPDPHPRWANPNIDPTNESGFSGLPGGIRWHNDGNSYDLGVYGYWWSSTEGITGTAWIRGLRNDNADVHRFYYNKRNGFSIRCLREDVTSVSLFGNDIPTKFVLHQNFPNPFNPSTTIKFSIPERANINLEIYNTLGKKIVRLIDQVQEPGHHEITFDASHLPSGVYIYRLQAGEFVESKKLILLK